MGRAPCCDKANVKKGPWSPEEDAKLKAYIEENGTGGNWIALPQKIGLKRCGKSCRLRWLNYLRPNIKHGDFSENEDFIICSLYISIGSRWSIIAAQLPGRTDNDIKNYWNTKLKKKLLGKKGETISNYYQRMMHATQEPAARKKANGLITGHINTQQAKTTALERMQLHMQLQSLYSHLYDSLALWPKDASYHALRERNLFQGNNIATDGTMATDPVPLQQAFKLDMDVEHNYYHQTQINIMHNNSMSTAIQELEVDHLRRSTLGFHSPSDCSMISTALSMDQYSSSSSSNNPLEVRLQAEHLQEAVVVDGCFVQDVRHLDHGLFDYKQITNGEIMERKDSWTSSTDDLEKEASSGPWDLSALLLADVLPEYMKPWQQICSLD